MRKLLIPFVFLTACATVDSAVVRPDYQQVDRTQTLRIAVVTSPLPGGSAKAGQLWSEIARRYVNDKRDFIVVSALAEPAGAVCRESNVDGVLHLVPLAVDVKKGGVAIDLEATLSRCRDGALIWQARSGGSWDADDDHLKETIAFYVGKYGPEINVWVAPSFHLLRATLDTLPFPKLEKDEDVMEKIELAD